MPSALPAIIRWDVDGGEIWMNLGAQPQIEIEYRVHNGPASRNQVLSEREVSAVASAMAEARVVTGRIEAGQPIEFTRPVRFVEEPPF